ncbi:glycosyltransferase [Peribacillus simplex]|uniref:N-acetylgalactosamine-N, N'-diacetylbacillosaminyl-diphospho-undecaprenol 4-alpha-N-acetylgalactosaminyltransferase n=1 Tax=Peribacillus simplex TaxID=1478 RepID=A0A9W4KSU8_9BACI|nr:glycosyltransferase [Peribacillus simplex]CAH0175363.1 N-acetylgalactosamine-N, N'-diacetylbacillosaminyl-diphospho-undecaprenol 4-alpha-N-acetylgalactosaminyltransferase [Peribacillus simplex]
MTKKVLFCIDSLKGGGAEKVLIDILNRINNKYDITLFLIYNNGVYLDNLPKNVRVNYMFNTNNPFFLKNKILLKFLEKVIDIVFQKIPSKLLYKLFIRNKFEVEIAFLEGKSTKLISGSKQTSKKIAWVHTNLKNHHWTKSLYKSINDEKKHYNYFNDVIFVSKDSMEGYLDIFNMEKDNKLKVIYNPIDDENIVEKAIEGEEKYKKFTVCSVGRLGHEKGFDRLIKAHARLISDGIFHNLIIIGDGVEKNSLIKLCQELGVEKTVQLLGFKKNPYKYIKNANLFVCSSRAEGYSLALAEAMILGLPVLSTSCGGTKEILDSGKYGFLVGNSADDIYNGIKTLLLNEQKLEYFKNMSIIRSQDFKIERALGQIKKLI